MRFVYVFVLKGSNGKTTQLRYKSGDLAGTAGEAFATAVVNKNSILTVLEAVTDATVESYVSQEPVSPSTLPAAADIFEEAVLTVYLSGTGESEKLATLRIPAPKQSIFVATTGELRDVVDINDADLIDFMDAINDGGAGIEVSDGEQINSDINEGLKSGHRRTRAI